MILRNRELIHHHKIIHINRIKIKQTHKIPTALATDLHCHRHTLGEQTMKRLIVRQHIGRRNPQHLSYRLILRRNRNQRIDAPHRRAQTLDEHHLVIARTLGGRRVGRNIATCQIGITLRL